MDNRLPTPAEVNELVALYNARQYAEMESRLLVLLEQCPEAGLLWKLLGAAGQMRGKDALPAFQRAAQLLPDDAEAHYNLGVVQKNSGQTDHAAASYQRAVALQPDHAEAHGNLGNVLRELGRLDAAVDSFRRALQIKPDSAAAHNNLGIALKDLGLLEDAIASYRTAVEIKPDFALAHNNLGNALKAQGQIGHAADSYRRAFELDPGFAEACINLGLALRHLGQLDPALDCLRKAVELRPGYAEVRFYLGTVQRALNQFDAAMESYRRAVALKPDYAEALYELGNALWDVNDYAAAASLLARAAQLLPVETEPRHLQCRIKSVALAGEVDPVVWTVALRYLQEQCSPAKQLAFLGMCRFNKGRPPAHNKNIFEHLALPLIQSALARRDFSHALKLHNLCLLAVAIWPHTQEQWAWCCGRLNPLFVEAGERYRRNLPALQLPAAAAGLPVVAFIVDFSVSMGSGLELLMKILEQAAPLEVSRIRPVVYSVGAAAPVLKAKCREWGMALVDFDAQRRLPYADDLAARLEAIRKRAQQDRVSVAALFATYEGFVCLASSIGLAPVHVYMTMGFHSIEAPRLDAYFAFVSLFRGSKTIRGRLWRSLPYPYPNLFPADTSPEGVAQRAEVAAVRAELHERGSILLGTLTRAEKLEETFLDAVAVILRQNPGALFLWFGETEDAVVKHVAELFEARGVADRCLFMGWKNTRIYSRVLDIHLDCFGMPAGLTMNETFSAGTPYVLSRGEVSDNLAMTSILVSIQERADDDPRYAAARALFRDPATGENLMMLAENADQYIAYANRLIRDPEFRNKVGAAAKQFMDQYFHHSGYMGAALGEQIAEIIADARTALR